MMFQSELESVDMLGNVVQTLPDLFNGEFLFGERVLEEMPTSTLSLGLNEKLIPNDTISGKGDLELKSEQGQEEWNTLMECIAGDSFPPCSPSGHSSSSEESVNNTQNLIDEMEDFLNHHESNDVKMSESDQILNALMKGQVNSSPPFANNSNDMLKHLNEVANMHQNISNISQIVTETGEKVVIVVAKDNSSCSEMSSDSEWSPSSPDSRVNKSGRKGSKSGYKRGPYKRSLHSNISDRKERKKKQNVEAARRYRDKKKTEQCGIEKEEETILKRNQELKMKLHETESELKTLQKLMVELGLIKIRENC